MFKSIQNMSYSLINVMLTRRRDNMMRMWKQHVLKTVAMMSSSGNIRPPNDILHPSAIDFKQLNDEQKRKLIELEVQILRETGTFFVPSESISESHWKELLAINSVTKRKKFYKYLKTIEMAKAKKLAKTAKNKVKFDERTKAIESNPHLTYGLWKNCIMTKVTKKTMTRYYDNNLRHAILFGQKFVIDMGYDEHMTTREKRSMCDQLQDLYSANKLNRDPFYLHFCNLPSPDSDLTRRFFSALPQLEKKNGLTKVTESSYIELFPRERLVYLTPDCREDLVQFNHDDIYIMAGIVDRGPQQPLSLAKAKREGLRMARLPLERHIDWGSGRKTLCLDHVMKILLTVKNTGDWRAAFEHVPKRFTRREIP